MAGEKRSESHHCPFKDVPPGRGGGHVSKYTNNCSDKNLSRGGRVLVPKRVKKVFTGKRKCSSYVLKDTQKLPKEINIHHSLNFPVCQSLNTCSFLLYTTLYEVILLAPFSR